MRPSKKPASNHDILDRSVDIGKNLRHPFTNGYTHSSSVLELTTVVAVSIGTSCWKSALEVYIANGAAGAYYGLAD